MNHCIPYTFSVEIDLWDKRKWNPVLKCELHSRLCCTCVVLKNCFLHFLLECLPRTACGSVASNSGYACFHLLHGIACLCIPHSLRLYHMALVYQDHFNVKEAFIKSSPRFWCCVNFWPGLHSGTVTWNMPRLIPPSHNWHSFDYFYWTLPFSRPPSLLIIVVFSSYHLVSYCVSSFLLPYRRSWC
jgi:hypothetical protein